MWCTVQTELEIMESYDGMGLVEKLAAGQLTATAVTTHSQNAQQLPKNWFDSSFGESLLHGRLTHHCIWTNCLTENFFDEVFKRAAYLDKYLTEEKNQSDHFMDFPSVSRSVF